MTEDGDGAAPAGGANVLLTGRPGAGKSTAVAAAADRLRERGLRVGGVDAPAIEEDGGRVGFALRDVATGESRVMAHADIDGDRRVGRYGVDVSAVDVVAAEAFARTRGADAVVVDEVAPMEVASAAFRDGVRWALGADVPVLGAVHRDAGGFVADVRARDDVEVLEVTRENRDAVPRRILGMVGVGGGPD